MKSQRMYEGKVTSVRRRLRAEWHGGKASHLRLKASVAARSRRGTWTIRCKFCLVSNQFDFTFCLPALPLQTASQPIQNGDKCSGKDPLTSDDSAFTDLSPKTDSSPETETPTKTDASSKTDVRPSTPGDSSSPQPKKGAARDEFIARYLSYKEKKSKTETGQQITWEFKVRFTCVLYRFRGVRNMWKCTKTIFRNCALKHCHGNVVLVSHYIRW